MGREEGSLLGARKLWNEEGTERVRKQTHKMILKVKWIPVHT